jgi:branched-chain amino acid transport system substrate-binding protein
MSASGKARSIVAGMLGATALLFCMTPLHAQDIMVGVTISTTGPAAGLGAPQRATLAFWPEEIAGHRVRVVQLDDAGDPSAATTNARRLVGENNVDVLVGSSTTPGSIAVNAVATEAAVPHFALAPAVFTGDRARWSFVVPQPVDLMAKRIFADMERRNIRTVGMIGFADSWGDLWAGAFKRLGEPRGLRLVEDVRYARADTSVGGQVLRLVAARPDAVLVAASGTGTVLPQVALKERGFTGPIYQTHGAALNEFIRLAGPAAEGVTLPTGPVLVAELQPETSPTRAPGMAFVSAFEGRSGPGSRNLFGAYLFDVSKILERAIPVALRTAKPGTPAFRDALRLAIESERDIAGSHGIYNFTATDRNGVDDRAAILVTVKGGRWALVD